jgi:hypothetical protein
MIINAITDGLCHGDGVTGDSSLIQAIHDDAPADRGVAVIFPPSDYRLDASLVLTKPNVALLGSPGGRGWTGIQSAAKVTTGGSRLLVDPGIVGLTYGDGANQNVHGPVIRDLVVMPRYMHRGSGAAPIVGGHLSVDADDVAVFTSMPSSGYLWVQDAGGKIGRVHYTSKDLVNNWFTGIDTIDHETIPATTYGQYSLITVPATGGIHLLSQSDAELDGVVFVGFNDQAGQGYGLFIDGQTAGKEAQYINLSGCYFWACNRSIKLAYGQFHANLCLFDAGFNNPVAMPNTFLCDLVDAGNGTGFSFCRFQGGATHIRNYPGPATKNVGIKGVGNRHEAWALGGYAVDLGGNGAHYSASFGSSHTGATAVRFAQGSSDNLLIALAASGDTLFVDQAPGSGNRVIDMASGQLYNLGPKPYTTRSRPSATAWGVGKSYYDTVLMKPLWSDGANWRDATGKPV